MGNNIEKDGYKGEPWAWLDEGANILEYTKNRDSYYVEHACDHLNLLRNHETDEIIGFQVTYASILKLAKKIKDEPVSPEDEAKFQTIMNKIFNSKGKDNGSSKGRGNGIK